MMDDRIFKIYMYVMMDKMPVDAVLYNLDKMIYGRCPSLAKANLPHGGSLNPVRRFIKEYATNINIHNICGTKEILKEGVKHRFTELNKILKEYNIHLHQDELDALFKKINKKIDRQWDGPTKLQLITEKIMGSVRRVLYKFYVWRIMKTLNGYLEEPIAVKIKKAFKVFG